VAWFSGLGKDHMKEYQIITQTVMTVTVCELENLHIEIVDLPIKNWWIFHSKLLVYQRVMWVKQCHKPPI
jgi:hypothetical protein